MSDTYNIGPTVPGLFAAHESRFKEAADEIDRLRAELATTAEEFRRAVDALVTLRAENEKYRLTIKFYQAKMDDLHDERTAQVSTLRAELTEARKPDCRRCENYFNWKRVCVLNGECDNGSEYEDASPAPVRLYEIDAAMAGGAE